MYNANDFNLTIYSCIVSFGNSRVEPNVRRWTLGLLHLVTIISIPLSKSPSERVKKSDTVLTILF